MCVRQRGGGVEDHVLYICEPRELLSLITGIFSNEKCCVFLASGSPGV